MTKPTIKSIIDFDKKIGTNYVFIDGVPGSGKSNIGHHLMGYGINRGGVGVMRGTSPCEWRHFYNLTDVKKINIFVPKELEKKGSIYFKHFPEEVFDDLIYVKFEELNLEHWLKPYELNVLYDECFPLANRCWIIVDQLKKLMYRTERNTDDLVVTYLEHEAGIIFPMTSLSPSKQSLSHKHWHGVNYMCHILVDFRKYLIRPVFIAQLSSEFIDLMRDKCEFKIYKKGKASTKAPLKVRKKAPFTGLTKYTVVVGEGVYKMDQRIGRFPETKKLWKMIPRKFIEYKCEAERFLERTSEKGWNGWDKDIILGWRNKAIKFDYIQGNYTQKQLGEIYSVSQSNISKIINS